MTILVGATCAAWKCDGTELAWLTHAEAMREDARRAGYELVWMLTMEVPPGRAWSERGDDLLRRLTHLGAIVWTFHLGDGEVEATSGNRFRRICTGRNLLLEYAAADQGIEWVLFLDTDTEVPPDTVSKLLEVDWPIVGGEVPTYCLIGPSLIGRRGITGERWHPHPQVIECAPYGFPVEERVFNTAGFLMVQRNLFRRLRWRWDLDAGMTDDPCFAADARELGYATLVRTDVVGQHHPGSIMPVEARDVDRSLV